MSLMIRPGRPDAATICGTICYDAFKRPYTNNDTGVESLD